MLKLVSKIKLKELLKNHLICLRCGIDKSLVKKEGSCGCKSWGTYYKKHLYK